MAGLCVLAKAASPYTGCPVRQQSCCLIVDSTQGGRGADRAVAGAGRNRTADGVDSADLSSELGQQLLAQGRERHPGLVVAMSYM